ncbi:MAG: hypothetical protein U0165_00100 [Polyangiaceae bacterium]
MLQRHLERFYHLDPLPEIDPFVVADDSGREALFLRSSAHDPDDVEIAVHLPSVALDPACSLSLDLFCQIAEGVSHFVLIAERARIGLPTTQLELELQAEVDKFVLLAHLLRHPSSDLNRIKLTVDDQRRAELLELHRDLYETARFVHPEGTELGDRYRLANQLAARLCFRLGPSRETSKRHRDPSAQLRHFFRVGQLDKLRLAAA